MAAGEVAPGRACETVRGYNRGRPRGARGTAESLTAACLPSVRPARLLMCGEKYGIVVNDRYGCIGHFRKGTCNYGRTIRRDDIERRVLAGLTDKLVSPEAVAGSGRGVGGGEYCP